MGSVSVQTQHHFDMQMSIASSGPTATSTLNKLDGCLLLQVDRGFIISINRVATLIWTHLEQNPKGLTLEEITDHVEASCGESPKNSVLRANMERDVCELLQYLEQRQVVKKRTHRTSAPRYRSVEGVLRTRNDDSISPSTRNSSAAATDEVQQIKRLLTPTSKDPSLGTTVQEQIAEINSYKSKTQTAVALLAFAAYDTLMKVLGFHRISQILTRRLVKRTVNAVQTLQVCAAIERARIWYPKEIKCMQHSAAIAYLLARCGLNPRLAIAGRSMPFQSHAWVELDGIVINDTQRVQQFYKVFAYFDPNVNTR